MLKRILKIIVTAMVVSLLVGVIINLHIQNIKQSDSINYLQKQIDELAQVNNDLFDNSINLEGVIQDYQRKLIESFDKLKEPNMNNLLNGSVFVKDIVGLGSGTVIKKTNTNMYILTCAHVVSNIYDLNQSGLLIRGTLGYLKNGTNDQTSGMVLYTYEVVKYDEENDLALIKTDYADEVLNEIPLAKNTPKIGDTVYSVGNPLGIMRTLSKGILANKVEGFYTFDGITTFGNSGGGLFNRVGELIGVPSQVPVYVVLDEQKSIPESSLGMCVSLERIKIFLEGVDFSGK
jgi:S1-C subfamily serine protease